MTPEQHEQQRRWVVQSLQVEEQRAHHHDTYPRLRRRWTTSPGRTEQLPTIDDLDSATEMQPEA